MLHHYSEGRVVLEVAHLRNPIIAMAVRKYIAKVEGVTDVKVKRGVITIDYNPEVLPTRVLLAKGQADLERFGIDIEIPADLLDSLPE